MFLNVRDMELRPLRISLELPVDAIDFLDPKLKQASPLKVEGQAELRQVLDEIRVKGHLKVDFDIECDRCLESYRFPVDTDFDLVYLPESPDMKPEEGLGDEDVEIGFYAGEGLELNDLLREQVVLALPMQRTCREDCQGLCPSCGENWNLRDCTCEPVEAKDHWEALRGLKLKS